MGSDTAWIKNCYPNKPKMSTWTIIEKFFEPQMLGKYNNTQKILWATTTKFCNQDMAKKGAIKKNALLMDI